MDGTFFVFECQIKMVKYLILIAMIFGFCQLTAAQNPDTERLDICRILQNPEYYRDNDITIGASYSASFESARMVTKDCVDYSGQSPWVKWPDDASCGNDKMARLLNTYQNSLDNYPLNGVFQGKFRIATNSGFGHMNASRYQFEIACVKDAYLLPSQLAGCRRLDDALPFQYLEFKSIESSAMPLYGKNRLRNKKEKIAWFSLVNNSDCLITFDIDAAFDGEMLGGNKLPLVFTLSRTYRSSNSTVISKYPDIPISTKKQKSAKLRSGESVSFSVPQRYLAEGYNLILKYKIINRESSDHELYFFGGNIKTAL